MDTVLKGDGAGREFPNNTTSLLYYRYLYEKRLIFQGISVLLEEYKCKRITDKKLWFSNMFVKIQ